MDAAKNPHFLQHTLSLKKMFPARLPVLLIFVYSFEFLKAL